MYKTRVKRDTKTKKIKVKPLNSKTPSYKQGLQFDVQKQLKPDKINPKKIFEKSK